MPAESLSIKEAKDHLPSLVRQVAKGARVTITVHGRPQADLVPHSAAPAQAPSRQRPVPVRIKLAPGPGLEAVLDELRGDR